MPESAAPAPASAPDPAPEPASAPEPVAGRHGLRSGRTWLLLVLVALAAWSAAFARREWTEHRERQAADDAATQEDLRRLTREGALHVDAILTRAKDAADALAASLTNGAVRRDGWTDELRALLASSDDFYGASVTFREYG